ncbi:MAG: hypothetical protein JST90_14665 [Bacteroidetes bacterium]|nr:hypothetical protein [Bacteroidota bacterium]
MRTIQAFIVEDVTRTRNLIKKGIEKFNSTSVNYRVEVRYEFEYGEDAIRCLEKTDDCPHLIFLDINLKGRAKGIELCRKFPDIAYIVISIETSPAISIYNETDAIIYSYITKASEGAFDSRDISIAIDRFVKRRGSGIYPTFVNVGRKKDVPVKDINFISTSALRIESDERGQEKIALCRACTENGSSIVVTQAMVNRSVKDHACLLQIYSTDNGEKARGHTLQSFVEVHDLNPAFYTFIDRNLVVDIRKIAYVSGWVIYFDIGLGLWAQYEVTNPDHMKFLQRKREMLLR